MHTTPSLDDGWVRAAELLEAMTGAPVSGPRSSGGPRPTGFHPLDELLGGGVRAGELTVVSGRPGVGKTLLTLQWARHLARAGSTVLLASYEHRPTDLLWRLLVSETAGPDDTWGHQASGRGDRRRQHLRDALSARALSSVVRIHPEIASACERFIEYSERLEMLDGARTRTDVLGLERLVADRSEASRMVVIVDHLQKVPTSADPFEERHTRAVAEQLKDLALRHDVAVIAVATARLERAATSRLRLHDLQDADVLAYEADVVLVVEEKLRALSRVHLGYDSSLAAAAREQIVLTIEKSRAGPAGIDVEHDKDLANFRFDPRGCVVSRRLVDGVEVLQ